MGFKGPYSHLLGPSRAATARAAQLAAAEADSVAMAQSRDHVATRMAEIERAGSPEPSLQQQEFIAHLDMVIGELHQLLRAKNAAYGNSALDPVRLFSKADAVEQLKVRIDDKLSRLARGSAAGEDVETDLLGYLVLLKIARRIAADGGETPTASGAGAAPAEAARSTAEEQQP